VYVHSLLPCRSSFLLRLVAPTTSSTAAPTCASALAERAACRLLLLWARHVALLRPLSCRGKLVLAKDLAELQLVVGQGLHPLDATSPALRYMTGLGFRGQGTGLSSSPLGAGSASEPGWWGWCVCDVVLLLMMPRCHSFCSVMLCY
jgi:hypothetical protein